MRVLFLNPPNIPFTNPGLLIEPIDILYLATFIKACGHYVEVIDMDVLQLSIEEIPVNYDAVVIAYDYHIPLHTQLAFNALTQIFSYFHKNHVKSIFIGKTVTYNPETIKILGFDIGILGEVELVLKRILESEFQLEKLKKINHIVYGNSNINQWENYEQFDFNKIRFADRSFLNIENYIDVRTILSSRGCCNHCSFCPSSSYWNGWKCRSVENVIEEIKYLYEKFSPQKILFLDDNMTVDKERMYEICKCLINKHMNLSFGCLSSINTYDKDMFSYMYQAGFRWVHFGIESGDQTVLSYHKNIQIHRAKEIILEVRKMGYRVRTSFILDLPYATHDSTLKTLNFILETEPDEVRLHFLSPRAGSELYKKTESQYIHSNMPVVQNIRYTKEEILSDIIMLKNELGKKYMVIEDPEQFKNVEKGKFVSFCPAKYGIGWEL